MNFFKTHLPPTLHNAAGTLIAAAVLAVLAGLAVFIKEFRDFSVPLWSVVILFAASFLSVIVLSKRKNQKHSAVTATRQEEYSDAKDALAQTHSDTQAKDQKTIERLTASNAQKDKEIAALEARVSDLEKQLAPFKNRSPFSGFQ